MLLNKKDKKRGRKFLYLVLVGFFLLNLIAFFHAYKFTHFAQDISTKTKSPEKLGTFAKLKTLFFGVNNPRPKNEIQPSQDYDLVTLQSHKKLEAWYIDANSLGVTKGTVIICHGYSGCKSKMLQYSNEFLNLGYNTLLLDFMGSGGSEGNQTTIGFKEARDVKVAYDYIFKKGEKNIYLFGTSMGAVSIMKSIHDYSIDPQGIILECPFGSMYETTCARFKIMNAPSFPLAAVLLFWGGIQNGISPFNHNPTEYAKKIKCPTLLMHGAQDQNVSRKEIDEIYKNIQGEKKLKIFAEAAHESYLLKYKSDWLDELEEFLPK